MPSGMAISIAISQPIIACGPPSADISSGMVMNGPMPTMFVMFRAVACNRLKRRAKWGCDAVGKPGVMVLGWRRMRPTPQALQV